MKNPHDISEVLEKVFERIHRQQMQGIPILNPAIGIEALGFQVYQGRVVGVLITPWLMNMVMLPRKDENWRDMKLGQKQTHSFPSRTYKFMLNEIDGIGICQTHSLYSPMQEFVSHEQAVKVAQTFIDTLMIEREPSAEECVDEELLGKVLRGEVTPETHFGDFSVVSESRDETFSGADLSEISPAAEKIISRRSLLRGKFQSNA